MPRVICELPNASDEISGVKFHPLEDGRVISDEVSDELAERFASIPGYKLDEEEEEIEPVKVPEPPKAPTLTKAQQKAKDKADKEAAEKAAAEKAAEEKAAEDKAAAEKEAADKEAADKAAAEAAAADKEAADKGAAEGDKSENEEVF